MDEIQCFVAMAFGKNDTNEIYDKWIKRAIEELGMIPFRVDRNNHNQRIDQKIRDEIKNSKCMIADLTYARPSVYYEAGYAEREIGEKVIYTCRNNHFKSLIDNRKIHFDLVNANIVRWVNSNDEYFYKSLKERLELVTKELREKNELLHRLEIADNEFSRFAVAKRSTLIDNFIQEKLLQLDFKIDKSKLEFFSIFTKLADDTLYIVRIAKSGYWDNKRIKEVFSSTFAMGYTLITQQQIQDQFPEYDINSIKKVKKFAVLMSHAPILPNSIENYFNTMDRSEIDGHYFVPEENVENPVIESDIYLPTSFELITISKIKSLLHLENWFSQEFNKICNKFDIIIEP